MVSVASQAIGFVALALGAVSFQTNHRKRLLYLQLAASVLWVGHFWLLGAIEAAAMNTVGSVRILAFATIPAQNARKRTVAILLIVTTYIVASVLTWRSARSILPLLGSLASTLALWQVATRKIRFLSVVDPPLWFGYNFLERSYPGMLNEIMVLGSVFIAILRYDVRPLLLKFRKRII